MKLYVEVIGSRYAFGLIQIQESVEKQMKKFGYEIVPTLEDAHAGMFVAIHGEPGFWNWLAGVKTNKKLIGVNGDPVESDSCWGVDVYSDGKEISHRFYGSTPHGYGAVLRTGDWFERLVAKIAHKELLSKG